MRKWSIRLVEVAVFVLLLMVVSLLVMKLAPGDETRSLLRMDAIEATQSDIEALRKERGLDVPIWEQYFAYLMNLLRLNFGTSSMTGKPVIEGIANALPNTLTLAGWSLVAAFIIVGLLGTLAARNVGKWPGHLAQGITLISSSMPTFWLGLLLLDVFTIGLKLLSSQATRPGGLIMPIICMTIAVVPPYVKVFRNSLVDAQGADFVRASRSRGLCESMVFGKHVLRAGLIPLVTIMGMSLGNLLEGTVVVEKIFAIQGIGMLALDSLTKRDYPMIRAFILPIGIVVFLINGLVDLSYRWLDPAIALKGRKA